MPSQLLDFLLSHNEHDDEDVAERRFATRTDQTEMVTANPMAAKH